MTRAPFVMPKAKAGFSRDNSVYDTTIGWRFVNARMKSEFGVDTMPETAENVVADFQITRADRDRFATESQRRVAAAQACGRFDMEITPVLIPQKEGEPILVCRDEHPREVDVEALAKLNPIVRPNGTVTAGNASGVNDGAAAMIIASERGFGAWPHPPRPDPGRRSSGCTAAHHGYRPCSSEPQAPGEAGPQDV